MIGKRCYNLEHTNAGDLAFYGQREQEYNNIEPQHTLLTYKKTAGFAIYDL
jgi:hypothetical protein